jgi:hypothetical protein
MSKIEQYRIDIGKRVSDAMAEACGNINPMCFINSDDKCSFYVPKIAIEYLKDYFNSMIMDAPKDPNDKIIRFMGHKVNVGYELDVIFVHDDYALFNKQDFISRVKI